MSTSEKGFQENFLQIRSLRYKTIMKVNVILITYNHSQYIRQTLESILVQEISHEVEIIVADDCSPDNTVDIIREYQDKTSFTFTFLEERQNLGYIRNYQRAFAACTGDYVAIMEGDDYWHKPNHLQNHIDYLEKYPESSMSFNIGKKFLSG